MDHEALLILLIALSVSKSEFKKTSFEIQLQQSGYWSPDEWIEYKGTIPQLTEFTTCHWEKLRYFARINSLIWAYCFILSEDNTQFNCVQLFSSGDLASANRDVKYSFYSHGFGYDTGETNMVVSSFRHRTWNHVCWVYSSITKTHQLYYNGERIETIQKTLLPVIPGSESTKEYAFIMGQEPDEIRGGFSASQAFYGTLAEFSLWNRVLQESEIKNVLKMEQILEGKVISWIKENFIFHGVRPIDISDMNSHLGKNKRFVIFPHRQSLSLANETCAAFGGHIVTPESKEENEEVMKIFSPYQEVCLENELYKGENEMAFWLGVVNYENTWFSVQENNKFNKIGYNNWTGSNWRQSFPGMCAYARNDGHWYAEENESCKFVQLCTICALPKIPVFSLKGLCMKGTNFQWQYYPTINSSNQIDKYEGFKRFQNISVINGNWTSVVGPDSLFLSETSTVFGRKEWNWHENSCSNGKTFKT